MAGGTLDPNGVWLFGEDDQRDTFSALLNIGQDSTSDAIGSDRGRIQALEIADNLEPIVGSGILVAGSGWSLSNTNARRKSGVVWLMTDATRTGSDLPVTATTGDVGDQVLATFNAGWAPASGLAYPISLQTRLGAGYISATQIHLTHLGPNTLMATGTLIKVMCTYPLG